MPGIEYIPIRRREAWIRCSEDGIAIGKSEVGICGVGSDESLLEAMREPAGGIDIFYPGLYIRL